jgi:MerR family transcriptional regulator, light-induced transcriptional regulator
MDFTTPQYPISFVARRTGLSTHVIRVWERRYKAVTPQRTESQRRLYSEHDVDRLRLLASLTRAGHAISQVAVTPTEVLREQVRGLGQPPAGAEARARGSEPPQEELQRLLKTCQECTFALNREGLEACLQEARLVLPPLVLLEDLLAPFMVWVGEQWHQGQLRVGHEHFASATVRSFLSRLRSALPAQSQDRILIVATPAGEQHEIGALFVSTVAAMEGWKDLYLGPNLPAADLAQAAAQVGANVIAVSVSAPAGLSLVDELMDLRRLTGSATTILVGGAGVKRLVHRLEEQHLRYVPTLRALQEILREH